MAANVPEQIPEPKKMQREWFKMSKNHLSCVCLKIMFAVVAAMTAAQCGGEGDTKDTDEPQSSEETNSDNDGGEGDTDTSDTEGTDTTDTETEATLGLLVDDFEDGDSIPLIGNGWFTYNDATDEGASTVTVTKDEAGNVVADGEGYESEHSLTVSYSLDKGDWAYDPYIGWGVNLGTSDIPFDASTFAGITYAFKGSAHLVLVQIFDVTDYDDYIASVPASEDWTTVNLPFSNFAQAGWGIAVDFNLANVQNLGWQVKGATGDTGSVFIDNVGFLGTGDIPIDTDTDPDLEINDPDPPTDETIDSVEIDNPMQELAMKSLTKGYNITNWLEQDKFETYVYDEETVNNLAANGFKSLRLPIDLDRYIADRDNYFAGTADFAVEDVLFEILDNFEQWTAAAGMGFTIDYHQYDKSFDMTDPLYVDAVIQLWTAVAEHFTDNLREDLFFEIMNEPEQAGGVDAVNQADWTDFATRIIDGIRSADTTHAIIFGDVEWNGISSLINRTPFEDDKIIYAFHFYEPFIFTHQGASWANLGTVGEIPYPYSTDRWSEYSSDFGILPTTDPWLISQLQSYYQIGNKSWMRNKIIDAKRWAVDNNVPVICDEFGAYDRTSLKEDRIRYYTDIIDIFEELEIPWQHWFMVMDDTGVVDSDLKAAMSLE
jgi:endoglucanase